MIQKLVGCVEALFGQSRLMGYRTHLIEIFFEEPPPSDFPLFRIFIMLEVSVNLH